MRALIGRALDNRSLRRYRSRLGWREAPKYERHWRECQRVAPRSGTDFMRGLAAQFWSEGWTFLTGIEGPFLDAAYQCDWSLYYSKSYTSEWTPTRTGSQRWHADGGPGTCIIIMRYESDVMELDGPLQIVPWPMSLEIFQKEPRGVSRDELCDYYDEVIKDRVYPPINYRTLTGMKGKQIAFMNNTLHRGGYPHAGHTRSVTVTHYYPSLAGTKFPREKEASYPVDPDV